MPVPKRKRSRARRDKRFANWGIKAQQITQCANCQVPLLPHSACRACGFYKGSKVLETKSDRAVGRHERKQAKGVQSAAPVPTKAEAAPSSSKE